jgi:large subunit ribosomal protein L29
MPILRMKEIVSMSSEDRTKKLSELRAELSRLRTMISAGGSVENPTRVRELRRTIAQILTVENENRLGIRGKVKEPQKTEAKPKKPKVTSTKKPKETKPE